MDSADKNNVLIKASGNVSHSQACYDLAVKIAEKNHVVLLAGAGKQINQAFQEIGFEIKFDPIHGRITKTWEEKRLCLLVLEEQQRILRNKFVGTGVEVEIPFQIRNGIYCPINGDNYVKSWYLGYEKILVLTIKKKKAEKEKIFPKDIYPKIQIRGL